MTSPNTQQHPRRNLKKYCIFLLSGIAVVLFFRVIYPTLTKPAAKSNKAGSSLVPTAENHYKQNRKSAWQLILVNTQNPIPADFTVNLVKTKDGALVDERILKDLNAMMSAAKKDKIPLHIRCAFRDVNSQSKMYKKYAHLNSPESGSAFALGILPPGCSEHHTGLAIDFSTSTTNPVENFFDSSSTGEWLRKNSWKYGFILRYPKDKESITRMHYTPWHYRYVGIEPAKAINKNHQCLEEYLRSHKS